MDQPRGNVSAQGAGADPSGKPHPDRAWDWVIVMPWLNFVLAAIVAALSLASSESPEAANELTPWTTGALLALAGGMIVWFVRAFTFSLPAPDDPLRTLYRRQIFIFAYAFTFISFVIVTMPAPDLFGIQEENKKLAPVSMFYGCFDYGDHYVDTPIPRCDPNDRNPPRDKPRPEPKYDPKVREHVYTLLLALGGSAAQRIDAYEPRKVFAVSGGLVMPLYIVLVAMIGGAISLSRRTPEIQKRSEPDFPGTPEQTPLQLYEAREQVVFQIMQLIAAPFIAICSFQMFAPQATSSAVALAFASGFASETILLMIRGVVDGIRPGIPRTIASALGQKAAAKGSPGATVTGTVVGKDRMPVAGATVWIDGASTRTQSDAAGKFVLSGVPLGSAVLRGHASDGSREAMMKLTIAPNTTAELVLS